jgi:DNA-binding SARP family transcriptional activator/ABC-type branched-subunit amino acid transport system substrate-binding protein
MRFLVLGPIEVYENGRELELGTGRQRAVLAHLLLHTNEAVSPDRLIDDLWGPTPPATAAKILQGYVSQLRRVLGQETIVTRPSGYVLQAAETDAREFEHQLDASSGMEPRNAARQLRSALALWRGRPYADVEYEPWAQAEIGRLEELRLVALEERIDADLRLGEAPRLVPELEVLVAEHPLRERLRVLLMLALYRSGRQADALEAYAAGRTALVDALGIEPGPELQEMQRRVLTQDPELGGRRDTPLAAIARRGRWFVLVGVALLVAASVAGVFVLDTAGGSGVRANSLVLLDSRSGKMRGQVGVGSLPSEVVVGGGKVWVLNSDDSTISEIDPATLSQTAVFAPAARPVDIASGADDLWVANGPATTRSVVQGTMLPSTVTKVDSSTRSPVLTGRLPISPLDSAYGRLPGTRLMVVGAGSVWTVGALSRLVRLDERTGRVERRFPFSADSLAFGGGQLWIVQQGDDVLRLDPATNRVDFAYPIGAGPGIAWGFGSAWLADPVQGLVWQIHPGPHARARSISVAPGTTAVTVSGGAVWAASTLSDEVVRIDPAAGRATEVIHMTAPQDLAPASHGVWVTTGPTPPSSGPLPATSCGPVVYPGPGRPRFIVASDLALQGSAGNSTRPIQQGVEESIRQHGFRAGKYTIGYQSCDDSTVQSGSWDFSKCVANARAYSSDLDVIGVVGTYNSGCANIEIPILNVARGGPVAMVSPINTDGTLTIPSLTQIPGYKLYPTGVRNYARVIGADQIQDAADAVLAKQLGARRVAVLDDGSPPARQADMWFGYSADRLDMRTDRIGWNIAHPAVSSVVARVRAADPDAVFFAAGGLPEGGPIVAALRRALPKTPVIVTDWFTEQALVALEGKRVNGVYASLAGAPNASLPAAGRRFAARIRSPLSYTAAYGGAATQVLLDAIARSNGTRASVAAELFHTHVDGILGNLRIDPNGDPVTAPVTIFRIRAGARNDTGVADTQDSIVDRVITPPPRIIPGATHPAPSPGDR